MKSLSAVLSVLALALVACETSETADVSKKDIRITRGMPISEIVSLIGQPKYVESGLEIGGVMVDVWHFEIIVSQSTEYQNIDTYIEPGSDNFGYGKPQQNIDDDVFETSLAQTTRTAIIDVMVYDNRVLSAKSEMKVTTESDWNR